MHRLISFRIDPSLAEFTEVSFQEQLVLEMAEQNPDADLRIGVTYRFPNQTASDRAKLAAFSPDEEKLLAVFKKICEFQPNMRAIYRKDQSGRWVKTYVSLEEAVSRMKIHRRPPKPSDLPISGVPSCTVYVYPDEEKGEYVYTFMMHHVGADAKGGFQILKSAGALDLGVSLHRGISNIVYYGAAYGLQVLTGKPMVLLAGLGHAAARVFSAPQGDVGRRADTARGTLEALAPYVPRRVQGFCRLGTGEANPQYSIYRRPTQQSVVTKQGYAKEMDVFRKEHLSNYGPLQKGVVKEYADEKGCFKLPADLGSLSVAGQSTDVTSVKATSLKWDTQEIQALYSALSDKFEGSGSFPINLFFEMIFGHALAYCNEGKPVPTRVPRESLNPQGHADYGATSTFSCGVDLGQPFLESAAKAKKGFKAQTDRDTPGVELHRSIPAEERGRRMTDRMDIQACTNYFPASMASNPFPTIPLDFASGGNYSVDLHLGGWFHKKYQVLVDNTVQEKPDGYHQTISINQTFMTEDFGEKVVESMKTIVSGLQADVQSGQFRAVTEYFKAQSLP